jgi:hypothetical protein
VDADLKSFTARLCQLSRQGGGTPPEIAAWPASLDEAAWFFSPELISLAGTETFARMSVAEQRRLSFFELVNFFSLNIHGERSMIAGLAQRLYAPRNHEITAYLHHFLEEENRHSQYFGEFCLRYAGRVYPDRKLVFAREYAPGEEELLFFAKILVFEEIVDYYNVLQSDDDRLHPLVASIHRMHHRDESRHLAFGRRLTAALFQRYRDGWGPETLAGVRAYLGSYVVATFREYHSFDTYRDARLAEPLRLIERSFNSTGSAARRRAAAKRCTAYLLKTGILTEDPLS